MGSGEGRDLRSRALSALAKAGTRRPGLVLAIAGLLVLIAALLVPGLRVTTSRHALVAPDNPYQARVLRFFERFGMPDSPVLVISGGSPEARRRFVDRVAPKLEAEPALRGRVLARVGPDEIAEVLLLQRPDLLASLGAREAARRGAEGSAAEILEGGLPAWIGAVAAEVEAGLRGPAADAASADQGLRGLAALARAIDGALAGEDGGAPLAALAGPAGQGPNATQAGGPLGQGVDEAGYLAGLHGEHHLIALFPDLPGDEGRQVAPLVARIRALRDAALAEAPGDGVAAELTGIPALSADELPIIERAVYQTTVASSVAILLLLVLTFRSARTAILCLVPLGAGTALTLGAARLLFGELNLITSSFVSVLLGLGIDFSVYLLSRRNELVQAGLGAAEATRGALVRAGPGVLTGAVTTMLAFLTTTTTDFTAYAELGVLTAVGLALTLLCALTLIPALTRVASRWPARTPGPARGAGARGPGRLLARLAPALRRGRIVIVAVAVVGAAGGAAGAAGIRFNGRYFDFLPARTESALGLARLERDEAMSPIFAAVAVEGLEAARAQAAALQALPTVASVQTPTDLLPPLDAPRLAALRAGLAALGEGGAAARPLDTARIAARGSRAGEALPKVEALADALDEVAFALRQAGRSAVAADEAKAAVAALRARIAGLPGDGRAAIGRLEARAAATLERALSTARRVAARGAYAPEDLPPLLRRRFVSRDGQAVALYARPAGDIWDAATARRFAADVQRVAPEATGLAVTIYEHEQMILTGFERAAGFSLALVLLVLLVDFRSLKDAAITLVPLAMGWTWSLGAMRLLGLRFDVANIVVLPLLLGIGVDAGAHMMHRCRESAAERGGVANLDEILRGTGGAMVLATTTTATGFAALAAADYGGAKSIGMTMTVGMSCCLLASLVVLPAALVLLGRAK